MLSKGYVDALTRCHTGGCSGESKVRPLNAVGFGKDRSRGADVRPACGQSRSLRRYLRSQIWQQKMRRRAETSILRSCPMPSRGAGDGNYLPKPCPTALGA